MSKARLGALLVGAYALGLVLLGMVTLVALPRAARGAVRSAVRRVPDTARSAASVARVAVHAGSLGVKHLPAALEAGALELGADRLRPCKVARSSERSTNLIRIVRLAGMPAEVLVLDPGE
ncbi:MAG TPA: hypothetical protein VEJ89_09690 [Myxococcaceae bacterium]|jgi:hypothetical protein|nr:hypothetical protein [Myxococcaceae bacterium]